MYEVIKKNRPKDINIEKPISDKKEVLTYYAFNEPALNGFSKELSESRVGEQYFIKFTKDIETATLKEILGCYLANNKQIDFLSIEVDEFDFMVLKSNNFKKHKPKVILIEIFRSSLSNIEDDDMSKFMRQYNYSIYSKSVNTAFFISDEFYI